MKEASGDVNGRVETRGKVVELAELGQRVETLKNEGHTVVHCHGVFDLIHVGHIRHLREAKSYGDVLVVTITEDKFVNKGPHRPAFPDELRSEVLAALDTVDFVAISRSANAVDVINVVRPSVYVKGPDYAQMDADVTGGIALEKEAVEAVGGRIQFTGDVVFSSSNLINRFLPSFTPEVANYLNSFKEQYSSNDVASVIHSLQGLNVVVIGEAILDEYVYCDQMGKSQKEPVLAMRYQNRELFAGGALAVANHVASFCDSVTLISYIGDTDAHEEFVRKSLKPHVTPEFIVKRNSPTILKRRYVESYLLSKLFELYVINDEALLEDEDQELCALIDRVAPNADVVIAADFGHGLLTEKAVQRLCKKSKFLAVNTQINAANVGFHTVSKFPRADYVCIQEGELRLDARSRRGDLKVLADNLMQRMRCENVLVTRGKAGTAIFSEAGVSYAPAFSSRVVDRIGAGDAVLSITSLCIARDAPPEVVGFVGNVIGAQAVQIVGNRSSIDRVSTLKFIESLLK